MTGVQTCALPIYDNDGKDDKHLFPLDGQGGTIDWAATMDLLRSSPGQYPLVLELKEVPEMQFPIRKAQTVFERLEELRSRHES